MPEFHSNVRFRCCDWHSSVLVLQWLSGATVCLACEREVLWLFGIDTYED